MVDMNLCSQDVCNDLQNCEECKRKYSDLEELLLWSGKLLTEIRSLNTGGYKKQLSKNAIIFAILRLAFKNN